MSIIAVLKQIYGVLRGKLQIWSTGLNLFSLRLTGIIPSQLLRLLIYRKIFGMRIESHVVVYGGAEIRSPENIMICSNTIIGHRAILDGRSGIQIGSNVNLSSDVAIWTVQHNPQNQDFDVKAEKVIVGDYVWLSFRCVILPGVTIGEGAVVAACAVVTKDVEPYAIVAGIPAKQIGIRNRNLRYELGNSFFPFI
jgi:acetyltransferase-like isoleucine patch superfamily enzyme